MNLLIVVNCDFDQIKSTREGERNDKNETRISNWYIKVWCNNNKKR